jgi:hypothetical protein
MNTTGAGEGVFSVGRFARFAGETGRRYGAPPTELAAARESR